MIGKALIVVLLAVVVYQTLQIQEYKQQLDKSVGINSSRNTEQVSSKTIIHDEKSKAENTDSTIPYSTFTAKHYDSILNILGGDQSRLFSTKFGPKDDNQTLTVEKYTIDASHFHRGKADVVVFPTSNEEVSKIMALCVNERIPIVAQGTLTGLEGGAVPYEGGVALNLRLMRSVIRIYEEDLQVQVQVGIKKSELNEYLEKQGLMFAVDPGSDSSIGGQLSTGASGTLSIAHGTIRENVIQLKVVLPDEQGTIITTKSRALKSSTGFDLTHLFVGSEGLLGIIVEATLKIIAKPSKVLASRVIFNTISEAAKTVIEIKSRGVSQMARCELINKYGIMAVNKLFNRTYETKPTLFFEFHGSDEASLKVSSTIVQEIAQKHNGYGYLATTDENEQKEVWHARRNVYYAAFRLKEGKKGDVKLYVTDVCVPISKLAQIIEVSEKEIVEFNEKQANAGNFTLPPAIVGHVADGNFHFMIPYLDSNKQELEAILKFNDELVQRAIQLEGTCSGEHGVGIGKQGGLSIEHSPEAVELMRTIKKAIDKNQVLNRGKVFPCCD